MVSSTNFTQVANFYGMHQANKHLSKIIFNQVLAKKGKQFAETLVADPNIKLPIPYLKTDSIFLNVGTGSISWIETNPIADDYKNNSVINNTPHVNTYSLPYSVRDALDELDQISVDTKKHIYFINTIIAQSETINGLDGMPEFMGYGHYKVVKKMLPKPIQDIFIKWLLTRLANLNRGSMQPPGTQVLINEFLLEHDKQYKDFDAFWFVGTML